MKEKKLTLEEFRAQRAKEAAARGHTLAEEMDEEECLYRGLKLRDRRIKRGPDCPRLCAQLVP